MSVLVKGMQKPEHCGYCRFRYDGICHALQKTQYSMDECPLIGIDEDVIKYLSSYLLPTIVGSETIRCKDCKYWNPHIKECEGIGKWFGLEEEWSENGFCFKGERREE